MDDFIEDADLRRDIEAYAHEPLDADEEALGSLLMRLDLGDEEVDYAVPYGVADLDRSFRAGGEAERGR